MIIVLKQLLTLVFWGSFQYILLESRYNRQKTVTVIISAIMMIFALNVPFVINRPALFYTAHPLTMYLPFILVFIFLSKQRDSRMLFNLLTALALNNMTHLPEFLFSLLWGYNLIAIILEIITFLPLLYVFYRYFRPLYLQMLNTLKKGWGLFCIVPLLYDFLVYFLFMYNLNGYKQTENVVLIIVVTLMVLAVYEIIIIFFLQTQKQFLMQSEQQLLKTQVTALQNQSYMVRIAEEKIAIYHHDTRHYVNNTLALLQSGDTQKAIEFLGKYDEIQKNTKIPYYCENSTINAILAYYLENAKQDGIEVKTKLDIPQKIPVDAIEICTVFANAIENAVNACLKLPEGEKRLIELTCVSKPHFVFEIANTYIGNVQFNEEGYPFSKDQGHGVGTISIAAFVKKHNAVIGYKAVSGMFRVMILLN